MSSSTSRQLGDRALMGSSVVTMMHAVHGYFRFACNDAGFARWFAYGNEGAI